MSGTKPVHVRVIVEPDERSVLDVWFENVRPSLIEVSDNQGCGCCVDIYSVIAPLDCFATLPSHLWSLESDFLSEQNQ